MKGTLHKGSSQEGRNRSERGLVFFMFMLLSSEEKDCSYFQILCWLINALSLL